MSFAFCHALFAFDVDTSVGALVGKEIGERADVVFVGSDAAFFGG